LYLPMGEEGKEERQQQAVGQHHKTHDKWQSLRI